MSQYWYGGRWFGPSVGGAVLSEGALSLVNELYYTHTYYGPKNQQREKKSRKIRWKLAGIREISENRSFGAREEKILGFIVNYVGKRF